MVWLPFFIFPYIGNNHPNWLIFFRGVNQPPTSIYSFELLTPNQCETAAMAINPYCPGASPLRFSFASLLQRSGISAAILVGRSENEVTGWGSPDVPSWGLGGNIPVLFLSSWVASKLKFNRQVFVSIGAFFPLVKERSYNDSNYNNNDIITIIILYIDICKIYMYVYIYIYVVSIPPRTVNSICIKGAD